MLGPGPPHCFDEDTDEQNVDEYVYEINDEDKEGLDVDLVDGSFDNLADKEEGDDLNGPPYDDVVDPLPANDFPPRMAANQGAQVEAPAPQEHQQNDEHNKDDTENEYDNDNADEDDEVNNNNISNNNNENENVLILCWKKHYFNIIVDFWVWWW